MYHFISKYMDTLLLKQIDHVWHLENIHFLFKAHGKTTCAAQYMKKKINNSIPSDYAPFCNKALCLQDIPHSGAGFMWEYPKPYRTSTTQ
jgi:hypothetical protein